MITKKILIAIVLLCLPNTGFTQSYPIYKNTSAIAVLDQEEMQFPSSILDTPALTLR